MNCSSIFIETFKSDGRPRLNRWLPNRVILNGSETSQRLNFCCSTVWDNTANWFLDRQHDVNSHSMRSSSFNSGTSEISWPFHVFLVPHNYNFCVGYSHRLTRYFHWNDYFQTRSMDEIARHFNACVIAKEHSIANDSVRTESYPHNSKRCQHVYTLATEKELQMGPIFPK